MQKQTDKFASMIGFAKRAGKIVYGYDALKTAKRVSLLAVSETASDGLKRNMGLLGEKLDVPIIYADSLEAVVGGNTKALGITDANMAKAMIDYAKDGATRYRINRTVYGGNE